MREALTIDLDPLEDFQYNQISNYKFEYMLLNPELRVVHSPFECKDYLQDIFWCEHNKKSSSIYGLKWKHGMYDVNAPFFYMALSGGSEILEHRAEKLEAFLNLFEEPLGIEPSEVYPTDNNKVIVVKFSNAWTINGPMLSAYTTLIRIAGVYEEGDPMQYIMKVKDNDLKQPNYMEVERYRLSNTITKLAALLEGRRPECKWSDITDIGSVHNTGIMNFSAFPTAKLPEKVK